LLNFKCLLNPTKQAKGDSGKEPKLHQVTEMGSPLASSPFAQKVYIYKNTDQLRTATLTQSMA